MVFTIIRYLFFMYLILQNYIDSRMTNEHIGHFWEEPIHAI